MSFQLACQLSLQSTAPVWQWSWVQILIFFFRPYFQYCSSSAHHCEDHFPSRLYPQFKYITFIYSQPFIHHFTGLFGTNIMTSSQLGCQLSRQSAAPVSKRFMGSNLRPYFQYCSSNAHYCEDPFHSRLYPQFKYMTFIYSQPFLYMYVNHLPSE